MEIPKYKVELYKFVSNNQVSNIAIDITDAVSLNSEGGIKTKKDTFSLNFLNYKLNNIFTKRGGLKDLTDNFIRTGDNIKIYIWTTDEPPSPLDSALIMDGEITSHDYLISEIDLRFSVNGVNRTEALLSTLIPTTQPESSPNNTAPLIIKTILNRQNKQNHSRRVSYALTTEENPNTGGSGFIQAVNSDGAPFPTHAYYQNYKSGYEQIEELSQPEMTGDAKAGPYLFYLVNTPNVSGSGFVNELVWKSKSYLSSGSLTEGIDFGDFNVSYDTRDVINAIITNAGQDLYGHGRTTFAYNAESMGRFGAKWKFLPLTNIVPDLIKNEKKLGDAAGSVFDERFIPDILDSGSWTFDFEDRDQYGIQSGAAKEVGNDEEYNNAFREEGKWQAKERAQGVADASGSPKYVVDFPLLQPRLGSFTFGDLYKIVSPSYGWLGSDTNPAKSLRLSEISYNVNFSGLTTTLKFVEDEKTIGVI